MHAPSIRIRFAYAPLSPTGTSFERSRPCVPFSFRFSSGSQLVEARARARLHLPRPLRARLHRAKPRRANRQVPSPKKAPLHRPTRKANRSTKARSEPSSTRKSSARASACYRRARSRIRRQHPDKTSRRRRSSRIFLRSRCRARRRAAGGRARAKPSRSAMGSAAIPLRAALTENLSSIRRCPRTSRAQRSSMPGSTRPNTRSAATVPARPATSRGWFQSVSPARPTCPTNPPAPISAARATSRNLTRT